MTLGPLITEDPRQHRGWMLGYQRDIVNILFCTTLTRSQFEIQANDSRESRVSLRHFPLHHPKPQSMWNLSKRLPGVVVRDNWQRLFFRAWLHQKMMNSPDRLRSLANWACGQSQGWVLSEYKRSQTYSHIPPSSEHQIQAFSSIKATYTHRFQL